LGKGYEKKCGVIRNNLRNHYGELEEHIRNMVRTEKSKIYVQTPQQNKGQLLVKRIFFQKKDPKLPYLYEK
jgi:hypothetical protein